MFRLSETFVPMQHFPYKEVREVKTECAECNVRFS